MQIELTSLNRKIPSTSNDSPEKKLIQKEMRKKMEYVLNTLSERQRQAFNLRYCGFSTEEGANEMGCSENAFKLLVFNATEKFRCELKEYL